MITHRLVPSLSAFLAITALSCSDGDLTQPVSDPPEEGFEIVVAGRILTWEGSPPDEVRLQVVIRQGSGGLHTGALVDEEGRFTFSHRREIGPGIVRLDLKATPEIGRGYDLGAASMEGLEVEYQPVPAADTTFVELTLPRNHSESRRPVWVRAISFRSINRPLLTDRDRVYYSSPGGVTALDLRTGACLWREGSSGGLVGLPYVVVGGVVAMARANVFSGLDAATGEVLWTRTDVPNGPFVADEPETLVATDGTILARYDPRTGGLLWTQPLEPGGRVSLAIDGELVCAERLVSPPGDARIECFDAGTGEPRWSRFVGSPDWVAITSERVVLAGGETERERGWIGLDRETGATVWTRPDVEASRGPALADDGSLVVGCRTGPGAECVAVRTADGGVVWRSGLDGQVDAPVVLEGSVYVVVGERPRSLYVLDLATGALRERIDPDPFDHGGFCADPGAGDGMVFVFGCSGYVYAFDVR